MNTSIDINKMEQMLDDADANNCIFLKWHKGKYHYYYDESDDFNDILNIIYKEKIKLYNSENYLQEFNDFISNLKNSPHSTIEYSLKIDEENLYNLNLNLNLNFNEIQDIYKDFGDFYEAQKIFKISIDRLTKKCIEEYDYNKLLKEEKEELECIYKLGNYISISLQSIKYKKIDGKIDAKSLKNTSLLGLASTQLYCKYAYLVNSYGYDRIINKLTKLKNKIFY